MRPLKEIIIHCSATPEGRPHTVKEIDGWHRQRGFAQIGYHFVVLLDGTVQLARPLGIVGAHVAGRNTGTIGVCYIGGMSADNKVAKDTRTPAQKEALLKLCRDLIAQYPTIKKVSGHNQYAAKACPSFDVRTDPLGQLV